MKLLNEFKTFAMRGNVIDMAVGVIMGGAFGKIECTHEKERRSTCPGTRQAGAYS